MLSIFFKCFDFLHGKKIDSASSETYSALKKTLSFFHLLQEKKYRQNSQFFKNYYCWYCFNRISIPGRNLGRIIQGYLGLSKGMWVYGISLLDLRRFSKVLWDIRLSQTTLGRSHMIIRFIFLGRIIAIFWRSFLTRSDNILCDDTFLDYPRESHQIAYGIIHD